MSRSVTPSTSTPSVHVEDGRDPSGITRVALFADVFNEVEAAESLPTPVVHQDERQRIVTHDSMSEQFSNTKEAVDRVSSSASKADEHSYFPSELEIVLKDLSILSQPMDWRDRGTPLKFPEMHLFTSESSIWNSDNK